MTSYRTRRPPRPTTLKSFRPVSADPARKAPPNASGRVRRLRIAARLATRQATRGSLKPLEAVGDLVWPNLVNFVASGQVRLWLAALGVGVMAAMAATAFRLLIDMLQAPWLGTELAQVAALGRDVPLWLRVAVPTGGGLVVGLLIHYGLSNRRAGSVPDVIESRALRRGQLPLREGLVSAAASVLSLGAGASAGREGPVVHLGATLAGTLARGLDLGPGERRMLVASGVAAAVSASFNAPVAGALFAHEIILHHYALSAFVPVVFASVTGALISRLWFGDFPAFVIPDYAITSYWEFPAFILLGLVCAVMAVIFQIVVAGADWTARRMTVPVWSRPVIGGFLIGLVALAFPEVLGVGYGATNQALQGVLGLDLLLWLLMAKTLATGITLASRFGGGVFSPALYLGAMTGGAFGLIAASVFPDLASGQGVYAIVGMGAVAGAVLGAPVSTTVMVLELTGGYAMTIAVLLAVSLAYGLSQAMLGRSYFQWVLETRGIFTYRGPHEVVLRTIRVSDFQTADDLDPESFDPERAKVVLNPRDTLSTALKRFDEAGRERLPVVDARDPERLVAWAYQVKALAAFNRALVQVSIEEHR